MARIALLLPNSYYFGMVFRQKMGVVCLALFSQYILLLQHTAAAYTFNPSQSIANGQTLISQGGKFELGFFTPSATSKERYLGIWYTTIPTQTVVWVANRDSPLLDTSGVLKISAATGNLVIQNQADGVVWSSSSRKTPESPIVEFLESGNLVLRNNGSRNYLWQSFDYPSDTFLPGMKAGRNFKTGVHHFLSSWKSYDDPSHGDFTYEITKYSEPLIRNGPDIYFRGGLWNGIHNSGKPDKDLKDNSLMVVEFVSNEEEMYYTYQLINESVLFRIVLFPDGHIERLVWVSTTSSWNRLLSVPTDLCDRYALCGTYSTCDVTKVTVCQCLKKFKPRSPEDWDRTDWSHGCKREVSLNCSRGEGFMKLTGVKLPDTRDASINMNMNLRECREKCLMNCSCVAYAKRSTRGDTSGCIMWFTDLVDIRLLNDAESSLYIRMAESALDSTDESRPKKNVITIVWISIGLVVLGLGTWCIWNRSSKGYTQRDSYESPLYDLDTIKNATNNFSEENKLGEGGFGPVYKGKLKGDEEIAVKRLSEYSIQGVNEFTNEVILISKLQHRNLVRLLGCCIQGEEKMLVYEYMQNKSLDSFIFDETKRRLLDWQKRFDIILGIARGLLYLHHDSRLRIIHRDLKASNILLDSEMVPKISDFGMARLFGGGQIEAQTTRVVGTYGYMSPEYAIDGKFSMKSDVFSFGVLILEMMSGKKNRNFSHPEHGHNLLGHAWRLWKEDRSMELVDEWMSGSFFAEDVLRCIQIGLLCVQKGREQRPSMPNVVLMLCSGNAVLMKPEEPGFYVERTPSITVSSDIEAGISNEMSMTLIGGR